MLSFPESMLSLTVALYRIRLSSTVSSGSYLISNNVMDTLLFSLLQLMILVDKSKAGS